MVAALPWDRFHREQLSMLSYHANFCYCLSRARLIIINLLKLYTVMVRAFIGIFSRFGGAASSCSVYSQLGGRWEAWVSRSDEGFAWLGCGQRRRRGHGGQLAHRVIGRGWAAGCRGRYWTWSVRVLKYLAAYETDFYNTYCDILKILNQF